jgi:glycosyltransferase involved in cell wall biosynthesis
MKTLYFDTNHIDLIGGGGLALYNLSVALQDLFEVYLSRPWKLEMEKYEFLRKPARPFRIGEPLDPRVHLVSKYAEQTRPVGDVNLFYCLYPRYSWDMRAYDRIFTLSEYSQKAIRERWGKDSTILIGGAFSEDYGPADVKEKSFVSSSRFFMEGDPERLEGHSKNQHIIIAAFRTLPKDLPWTLDLAGSVLGNGDKAYLDVCRRLAGGDSRIRFHPMATREELRDLYAKAEVAVFAMGYGRSDPAEVEHYGIAVEKALISGCYTIVHDSGGSPEFAHEVWNRPLDLATVMGRAAMGGTYKIADQQWRNWPRFAERVREEFHAYA